MSYRHIRAYLALFFELHKSKYMDFYQKNKNGNKIDLLQQD